MASKLVGLLIVAAVFGVLGHQSEVEAREVYGNDNWVQAEAAQRIVQRFSHGKDLNPGVLDTATYLKYMSLGSCYNGTITLIEEECAKRSCDVREDLVYKLCLENQKHLLEAYMSAFTHLTGSAVAVPVHFLKDFQQFVVKEHLDASQVAENLALYPGTWEYRDRLFNHKEYCERMIELIDVEFAQWGYNSQELVEFLSERTMMPVGEALDLCRKRVQL